MSEVDIFSVVEMSLFFLVSIFLTLPCNFFLTFLFSPSTFPHQLLPSSLTSAASEADSADLHSGFCFFLPTSALTEASPFPMATCLFIILAGTQGGSALFHLLLSTWPNHCSARPPLTAECRYGNRQPVGRGDTMLSQNQQEETLCSICGG